MSGGDADRLPSAHIIPTKGMGGTEGRQSIRLCYDASFLLCLALWEAMCLLRSEATPASNVKSRKVELHHETTLGSFGHFLTRNADSTGRPFLT